MATDENNMRGANVPRQQQPAKHRMAKTTPMRKLPLARMTVEDYLNAECEQMTKDIQNHADKLVEQLKADYQKLREEYLVKKRKMEAEAAKDKEPTVIEVVVEVLEGKHEGTTFRVCPKVGTASMIGRSRGKKFQNGVGISLCKDQEVSTSHGKFEMTTDAQLAYVDTGSLNGSKWNDNPIAPEEQVILSEGDRLMIGSNVLKLVQIHKK